MRSIPIKKLKEVKGLVLRSFVYGEYDKIYHIFTEEEGIIHLIAKGALRPRKKNTISVEPLMLATFFYIDKPHQKLFQCAEIVQIDSHLYLREHIDKLDCACQMVLAVASTQMGNQPAPLLFRLICYYLKKLEHAMNTASVLASFQLKLLRHDGVLSFPVHCSICETPLLKFWFYEELSYCKGHAPMSGRHFNEEEAQQLERLTLSTQFSDIEAMHLSETMMQKINLFFEGHVKQHTTPTR